MITRQSDVLPYRCEQVFDLVADIGRYPEFLPGCLAAEIVGRDRDVLRVSQVMGFGVARLSFTSTATLLRPHAIDITAGPDGPFRRYALSWRFAAEDPAGCRVSVAADLEMRSGLLQSLLGPFLAAGIREVVRDFEGRARLMYPCGESRR